MDDLLRTMDRILEGGLAFIPDGEVAALRDRVAALRLRYTRMLLTVELLQRRAYAEGLHPGGKQWPTATSSPLEPATVERDPFLTLFYALTLTRDRGLVGIAAAGVDLEVVRNQVLALLSKLDREIMREGLAPEEADVAAIMAVMADLRHREGGG